MKIEEIRTGRTVDVHEKLAAVIVGRGRHRYANRTTQAIDTPAPTVSEAEAVERSGGDYETEHMEAEEVSPRTGKPKRQYRRRDMRAED